MRWMAFLTVLIGMLILLVGCAQKEVPAEKPPTKTPSTPMETATPEMTTPEIKTPSKEVDVESLVSAMDNWIKPVLERASGGEVKLLNYQTEQVTELSGFTLYYDLPQNVIDENTMMVDPKLFLKIAEMFDTKPEVKTVQAYDLVENFVYIVEIAGPLEIGKNQVAFVRISITTYQPTAMVDVWLPTQVDFGDEVVYKARDLIENKWLKNVSGSPEKLKLVSFTGTGHLVDGGTGKGYSAWLIYDVGQENGAEILCGQVGEQGLWRISVIGGCMDLEEFTLEYAGQKVKVEVRGVARYENPKEVVVSVHAMTGTGMSGLTSSVPNG